MLSKCLCVCLAVGMLFAMLPRTVLATEPAPLTQDEQARYGQMQADAVQDGVLARDGGMDDQTKWLLIGGAVVVVAVIIWVW